jgi:hypothetical protein
MMDQQAPVALQTTEGLLDPPAARLDREAGLVFASDQLELDAVALHRGCSMIADGGEVGPTPCAGRPL